MRSDPAAAKRVLQGRHIDVEKRDTFSTLVDKALKHAVWPKLVQPTFAIDYPLELSPLAKSSPDDPLIVERFQPIIAGREMGNAFSELNDPLDQRRRFEEQARNKEAGDEEATCSTKISYARSNTACLRRVGSASASTAWPCCCWGGFHPRRHSLSAASPRALVTKGRAGLSEPAHQRQGRGVRLRLGRKGSLKRCDGPYAPWPLSHRGDAGTTP